MRLFLKRSGHALVWLAQVGVALGAAALIAGCGNNSRPVVTPVNSSGPPPQPNAWAIAVSAPSPSTAGQVTIIDYSGDSILVKAPIGIGPTAFTLDNGGNNGYSINSNGTITNFPLSTSLQLKQESVTALPPTALPQNIFAAAAGLFIPDLTGNAVDLYSGSPENYKLSISLPATPVFTAGQPSGTNAREYAFSLNFADPTGLACNLTPRTAPASGVATPIETSNDTRDPAIPVGMCPVYAVQSPDLRRMFVMNRGDDTITVINTQKSALDNDCPAPAGCVNQNGQTYFSHPTLPLSTSAVTATGITPPNGTSGMTNIAGPIYAEYSSTNNLLVVADFDGGTISVIDVSLDEYGNDSSTFGTTYTIPVGNNPASVTVLTDSNGTRAYTANQADGTVTIANLSSYSVEKTLTVVGHPRTVVSTANSLFGKVYTASPDSPYITIVETKTDLVDTTVLLEGNAVDVRTSNQNGVSGNNNYTSRMPGYGQPCNLPPALMVSTYGAGYTLAQCRQQP
jgi:hypothetical protein